MKELIEYNASLVIKQMQELLGVKLAYDEKSVTWIDNYIAGIRADLSPSVREGLVSVLGSFFGECIRRRYGGEWKEIEGRWAIAFDDHNVIYPLTKVGKHFESEGNSILSLYASIPLLFKDVLKDGQAEDFETDDIAGWLDSLQSHEYLARKYRFKGDAWYDMKNERLSMEYHNLAADEERQAKEIAARLEERLGQGGEINMPGPEEMEMIRRRASALSDPWDDDPACFDDACFYARHPQWGMFVKKLSLTYQQWKDDPRFLQEAPNFRPVNPGWEP